MTAAAPPKRPPDDAADEPAAKRPAPDAPPSLSTILFGLPSVYDDARLRAFLSERGVAHATARTKRGSAPAFIVFGSTADRAAGAAALDGFRLSGRCRLKLRDAPPRRKGGKAGALPRAVVPARDIDLRDVVTPWWRVPYARQLADKRAKVEAALAGVGERVAAADGGDAPAWAAAPIPLVGVVRSPTTVAYRNKNEFTAGLDVDGSPCVGFCLGAFRDGVTQVGAPAAVAHVSTAALALADAMTTYVRSESALPVWDKRVGRGFWRQLTVREGRARTLLPRPGEGADGASDAPPFGELDWRGWLVGEGGEGGGGPAADGDAGAAAADPAAARARVPHADTLAAVVQVNPAASPDAATTTRELAALAAALRRAAARVGAPRPALATQHHAGVSNAAPAGAPLLPCPGPGDDDDDDDTTTPATTTTTTTTPPPSRGLGAVTDALCGLTFRVSPTAFFQVNPGAAALLYRLAVDWAAPPPGGVVYDVCCGTGTLGIAAAAVAGRGGEGETATTVLGVDIEPSAIEDAVANAAANGVSAARFVAGRAEDALAGLLGDGGRTCAGAAGAVAIVDPPRAGLHPRVRAALRAAPSVARIVYVSCNPASLADDMVALCARSGGRGAPFAPVRAAAVDLFPHTAHVESVVLLERGAAA